MTVLNVFLCLLFVVMAGLQLNDPDPLFWFVVYLATAWNAGASAFGRCSIASTTITLGMVAAGLLISVDGFADYVRSGDATAIFANMDGDVNFVEPAREFLGLTIALVALIYFLRQTRRNTDHRILRD